MRDIERYSATTIVGDPNQWREVASYGGRVGEVGVEGDPGAIQIVFTDQEGEKFSRIFPRQRLEDIGAAFRGARVRYTMYDAGRTWVGSVSLAVMECIGLEQEDLPSRGLQWPTEADLLAHEKEI